MAKVSRPHLLVVGGTGFIGHGLLMAAKKRGWQLSSVSLKYPKKNRYLSKVKYILADVRNLLQLKKKLRDRYDYVVNLSGYGAKKLTTNENKNILETHFLGVVNLVSIFEKKKILKFVQIGTGDEYGFSKAPQKEDSKYLPYSTYGYAKYYSSEYLKMKSQNKNFPSIVLRFFLVYGPHQNKNKIVSHAIINCLMNKKFYLSKGVQKRDYCYIDDITRAIFLALKSKHNGEIINIGSGKPLTVRLLVNYIRKLIGRGKPVFGGIKYRKYENMEVYPNIGKAIKKIKWKPKISLEMGIKSTIDFYKKALKIK